MSLGVATPGCGLLPNEDDIGQICAAPADGGEHCQRADYNPELAWNAAAGSGAKPIQMWATWPSRIGLDALVGSREKLNTWFDDIDKVVVYVRDQQQDAESYRASLAGNLGALAQQAADRQDEILTQGGVDAIGHFKQAILDKASAAKGPLLAEIASDKQSMAAVKEALDQAKRDLAPLQAEYARVAQQFAAYRASEVDETGAYVSLPAQASAATLGSLDSVEQATFTAAHAASGKPNDLVAEAMKLSAELEAFEIAHQAALTPYAEFVAAHGAVSPDMTSSARRSLNAMLAYAAQRVARSDATASALIEGIAMRRAALVLLQAAPAQRDAVAAARLLAASATFRDDASARVAAIAKAPPTSAKLKLPYLAARHDLLTALLQLRPLCAPSSSWREAGCALLRGQFSPAEAYLNVTLPRLISTGLAMMRADGVDAAWLDAVQTRLAAGDLKGAALAYDAAVQSSEGT